MEMDNVVGGGKSFPEEHAVSEDNYDHLREKILIELLSSQGSLIIGHTAVESGRRSGGIRSHF